MTAFSLQQAESFAANGAYAVIAYGLRVGEIRPIAYHGDRRWTAWLVGTDGVARPVSLPHRIHRDSRAASLAILAAARGGGS